MHVGELLLVKVELDVGELSLVKAESYRLTGTVQDKKCMYTIEIGEKSRIEANIRTKLRTCL